MMSPQEHREGKYANRSSASKTQPIALGKDVNEEKNNNGINKVAHVNDGADVYDTYM